MTHAEVRNAIGTVFMGVESPPANLSGDDLTPFPSPQMGKLSREFLCLCVV